MCPAEMMNRNSLAIGRDLSRSTSLAEAINLKASLCKKCRLKSIDSIFYPCYHSDFCFNCALDALVCKTCSKVE